MISTFASENAAISAAATVIPVEVGDGSVTLLSAVYRPLILLLVFLPSSVTTESAFGGDSVLTSDEQQALHTITPSKVTSTVSYLASDALAGRDTPSPELKIASAYVASRFQSLEIEGLGADRSFFQTTTLPVVAPGATAAELSVDGMADSMAVVWLSAEKELRFEGILADGMSSGTQQFTGPVVIDETPLPPESLNSARRAAAVWRRRIQPLINRGATAVLIRITADSALPELARNQDASNRILPDADILSPVPVLLVDEKLGAGCTCRMAVAACRKSSDEVSNVIGCIRGSDPELAKQAIIISAHLDHIGRQDRGKDLINNGADDNASGVTAVLMLAEAYAALKSPPERTVILVTFWGEEKGLLGSKYFVRHPVWPLDQIVANINIEMIGRPETDAENRMWGTGWNHSSLGPLMALGAARADVTIFHHPEFSEMLYTRSDNDSFVRAGVIAHSFSASSLHSDYHQPSDEFDKLNIPHMTRIIQGLFAGTLPIARGTVTPEKTRAR